MSEAPVPYRVESHYRPTNIGFSVDWATTEDDDGVSHEWIIVKFLSTTAEFVAFLPPADAQKIAEGIDQLIIEIGQKLSQAQQEAKVFTDEGMAQRLALNPDALRVINEGVNGKEVLDD